MRRIKVIRVTTLVGGILGCAGGAPAELTETERADVTAAVTASVDGYRDAALRLDLDGMLALWADVDGFALASDGELIDYPTLEQQAREEVTTMQSVLSFEFSDRRTVVLARDAASHTARFRWAAVLTTGDTLRVRGSWIYVLKNLDGVWRVVQSGGTHIPE